MPHAAPTEPPNLHKQTLLTQVTTSLCASILGERLFEMASILHYSIVFYTALAGVVHCIEQDVIFVRAESKASDSVRVSLHCVCYVTAMKVPDLAVCVCECVCVL